MIPTYCIAHREPKLSAHLYEALIHTPPRPDYAALVSVVAHPVIAQLVPTSGLVNICGYRKIVTHHGGTNHKTITTAQCARIPRVQTEPHSGFDFLLCNHDFFKLGRVHKSIREQWDAAHHKEDLRDCLNLAVEMGVMTAAERLALEAEPALIEGGCSMGVFPASLVREILAKVWPLYQEFARRYRARFMRYDPMQRRCIPFLAERVETHFILRELRQRYTTKLPPELFGCLTASWDGPWEAGRI
ncbi:MAG TPA: hypothetical protein VII35_13720 [Steroidobacteraceae bacterium]